MRLHEVIARTRQTLTFARHIPLAKLARRAELSLRRRIGDLLPRPQEPVGAIASLPSPPLPLFPPRKALVPESSGARLRFTFLNRAVEIAPSRIDWEAPGAGAANQLWRMNLHYMEYLEGLGSESWAQLVTDWIRANPKGKKGAWRDSWNSYTLSLRVIVWLQELARRKIELPKAVTAAAEASLASQLRYLERNLETDLGGNHLIKNIKALLWASAYFEGGDAERWHRTGVGVLSKELQKQILPDGMQDERSASYHAQVFADLLECRHALGEDPLGGALDETLQGMAQVTADLTHPDGGPVLFNDSGLTMAYSPAGCLDVYEQIYSHRPRPQRVFALSSAGYYGLRAGDLYMVADCGRIAPDDLPAHGHADVLSFELSIAGRRVIVDQGVFEYVAGEKRRRARSASSHNTLCFEGADQAEFFGAFRCGRRPDVRVLGYEARADGFVLEGTHDGFQNLPGEPRHVRRFDVAPRRLSIHDRIDGRAGQAARIAFLLHPEVEAEIESRGATLKSGGAAIKVTSSEPIKIEPAVWWPDMGVELRTSRLVIRLAPPMRAAATEFEIGKS
jgi:uncharacterized heparinase superfamily protein